MQESKTQNGLRTCYSETIRRKCQGNNSRTLKAQETKAKIVGEDHIPLKSFNTAEEPIDKETTTKQEKMFSDYSSDQGLISIIF